MRWVVVQNYIPSLTLDRVAMGRCGGWWCITIYPALLSIGWLWEDAVGGGAELYTQPRDRLALGRLGGK